jgi:DNA invertase Pin-like site-specific DNA recombinase
MTNKNHQEKIRAAAMVPTAVSDEVLPEALAYYRVSTTEQANTSHDEDGFSIQAQREYCQRKATDLGAQIVEEYVERGKSARSADRPELQAMLRRIADDPDIHYLIVHKLDRLARNREDDVQIGMLLAKHGVKLVSATENIDETPGGKLVHGIMATIAEWYSGNLSQEARKGLRKKVEIGGTPGKAPLGYQNIRDKSKGKDIGLVIIDALMGPIITEAFRLYATGLYTLGTLTDELNHLGLRMPETKSLPERPVQIQHVHRILRNPYYTGIVTYNGVAYPGGHDPLVDELTFELVQAILTARNLNKDKSKRHPHPLKGNLYCGRCGRRLGITTPTNRHGVTYDYFYCLGRQKDRASCAQPYIPVADLEAAVADYFRRVRMPRQRLTDLRDQIAASFAGRHADGAGAIAGAKARIHKANQRARKNKEAYYADALSLEDFKLEQDKTKTDIAAAEKIIAKWSIELDSIKASLDEALSLLIDPYRLFIEAPDKLRLLLTQAIFDKLWIMGPEIAGAELTDTYHELLTVEARLAEQTNQQVQRATNDLAVTAAPHTYHRRRLAAAGHTSGPDCGQEAWLGVERPSGPLPIDNQNPASTGVRRGFGSDVNHLVGVAGFEPTASSSRTAGRAVNGGYFRRSPVDGGRCRLVLVGGVAVLRSCTTAPLAAQGWGLIMDR